MLKRLNFITVIYSNYKTLATQAANKIYLKAKAAKPIGIYRRDVAV